MRSRELAGFIVMALTRATDDDNDNHDDDDDDDNSNHPLKACESRKSR